MKFLGWLEGKKTMIGGALIAIGGLVAVWMGVISPESGLTLVGAGIAVIGFADKANRHQEELLAALKGVARAGAEYRAGNRAGAIQEIEHTVENVAGEAAHEWTYEPIDPPKVSPGTGVPMQPIAADQSGSAYLSNGVGGQ
jgi:hypothetical protein